MTDTDVKIDVAGFAALSLGLVFTSTCNGDAIEAIIQALMMRGELELSSPFAKFLALGLGLLFLGRQEAVEPTVEVGYTPCSFVVERKKEEKSTPLGVMTGASVPRSSPLFSGTICHTI